MHSNGVRYGDKECKLTIAMVVKKNIVNEVDEKDKS